MNKRLLKKVFAAVLSIAMVFNLNAIPALAEDEVKVEFVYTNVKKLTIATGTTRQITTYTVPDDATNQEMRFLSSDRSVATVSVNGVVTAISPGIATITVMARDGSRAKETVTVNVVKNLVINEDNVDSDGEVIVFDETYGNVSIDNSVGSADIYLSGVTVMNKLLLEKGNYNVYMFESSADSIEVVESLDDIVSFSTDDNTDTPGLYVYDNSSINGITAGSGINLSQDNTSEINTLTLDYNAEGDVSIDLEGFSGNLIINASGSGTINLNLSGSNIANVTIIGGTNSGTVVFNNVEGSRISDLTIGGSANVNLQTPAGNVNIGSDSEGSSLTLGAAVTNLNNSGTDSSLTINAQVSNLVSTGSGNITLSEGADITNRELGTGTTVRDNSPAGSSGGAGGAGGGAGGVGSQPAAIEPGAVIIDENFEDGLIDNLIGSRGLIYKVVSADGKMSDRCMLVGGRTQTYHGLSINVVPYTAKSTGKHVTLVFTADVKYTEGADTAQLKFTADDGKYTNIASVTANKGQWATLTGTYTVIGDKTQVYLEADNTGNYYVDNLNVSIQSVSDLVYVDSISLDRSSAVIGIGGQVKLNAEVLPANAEDLSVTWSSSDPTIASVDTTGLVTAYKGGTVIITADSNYSGKKAFATVTVDPTIMVYEVKINKPCVVFTEASTTLQLSAAVTLNTSPYNSAITWASTDSSVVTINNAGLLTAVADGTATVTASTVVDVDGTQTTYSATCRVIVDTNALYVNTYDDPAGAIGFTPMGNATVAYENGYVKASNRTQGYEGGSLSTAAYNGKEVRFTADVKHGSSSPTNVIITYNTGSTYTRVADSGDIPVGEWRTITGTIYVNNASSKVYFESSNASCDLYYDNIIISEIIQVPTPITGVTISNTSLSLNVGQERTLTAAIVPERATTSRELTWTSSDQAIATVDATGKVTAVSVGSATITVTTKIDGISTAAYSDTCTVTVSPAAANPADTVTVDFESMAVGTTLSWLGYGSVDDVATVIEDPNDPSNKLLEVKPSNYNSAPIINVTIPTGNTLYDYSQITYKALWKQGDVGWKTVRAEAGTSLSGTFNSSDRLIGSYYRNAGTTTALGAEEITLGSNLSDLSGNIQIALGISCAGEGSGNETVYYLDDITLVPKVPRVSVQPVIFNFEGTAPAYSTIAAAVTAITTSAMAGEVATDFTTPSSHILKVENGGWETLPKFGVTLPVGKTLADYTQVEIKYYAVPNTDANYKNAYVLAANELVVSGSAITAPSVVGSKTGYSAFTASGSWATETINLDAAMTSSVSGSSIELAVGISANAGAKYFIDDVTLITGTGERAVVADFEGAVTAGKVGEATLTATVITQADFAAGLLTNTSSKVLKLVNTNWSGAVVLEVTLADGVSIDSYASVTCKAYLPTAATTDDANGYYYKDFSIKLGETITDMTGGIVVTTENKRGSWVTFTFTLNDAMKSAVGNARTFKLAIGIAGPERTVGYYIDDITLVPNP